MLYNLNSVYQLDLESAHNVEEQSVCGNKAANCSEDLKVPACGYQWIAQPSKAVISAQRVLDLTQLEGTSYMFQCQIVCQRHGQVITADYDVIVCRGKTFKIIIVLK